MTRVINCEDCNTYLGEIRDARLVVGIKYCCKECSSKQQLNTGFIDDLIASRKHTNDEFRGMDKSIADFFSKDYVT